MSTYKHSHTSHIHSGVIMEKSFQIKTTEYVARTLSIGILLVIVWSITYSILNTPFVLGVLQRGEPATESQLVSMYILLLCFFLLSYQVVYVLFVSSRKALALNATAPSYKITFTPNQFLAKVPCKDGDVTLGYDAIKRWELSKTEGFDDTLVLTVVTKRPLKSLQNGDIIFYLGDGVEKELLETIKKYAPTTKIVRTRNGVIRFCIEAWEATK